MFDRQLIFLAVVMLLTLFYALGTRRRSQKLNCVAAVTILMTLFSGLRSWWMGDLIKYYTQYLNCTGPNWQEVVFGKLANVGIRVFFHYGNLIGLSYDACIFLIAAFSAITLGVLIYRYSPSPYWSYLMYIAMGFFIFTFSGLKQTIAMGFICIAMIGLLEGRFKMFLVWTLVGALFHAPAMIFLGAYPFARKKPDSTYLLILFALVVILYFFRNRIIEQLAELYYDDEQTLEATSRVGGRFLMMLFILALGYYLRPLRTYDKQYGYVFNIMIVAAALQTFSIYDNVYTRLTDYYYQFVVLFVPMMLQDGKEQAYLMPEHKREIRYHARDLYILLSIGTTVFAIWYYRNYVNATQGLLNDFKFFWELDPYLLYGS
ncbi:MAG: EpsG family protein [Oscillospiraceae bacterium]|nr:EpsG family protein [Oscillospiraceae bacterium]